MSDRVEAHRAVPMILRGVERCSCGWSRVGEPGAWQRHADQEEEQSEFYVLRFADGVALSKRKHYLTLGRFGDFDDADAERARRDPSGRLLEVFRREPKRAA